MAIVNNFKDSDGKWVAKQVILGKVHLTKSGAVWDGMKQRCKVGGSKQADRPNYVGCTMSENFKNFQFFVNWHMKQIGFDLENYHIDKDILFANNQEYHEEKCVLVPQSLNSFVYSRRGSLPTGVSFNNNNCNYRASIGIDGKLKRLGSFNTAEAAFAAYKDAKETEARRWHVRLQAGEFMVDPRVIERLRVWTLES